MTETKTCPKCRAFLPENAPSGICPKCLMQAGLESEQNLRSGSEMRPTIASGFVPPEPKELAKLFPQLEILELVGQGGMGAVYKARQPGLDRFVAVKILPPEVGRDPAFVDRFSREAKALAKLTHPNIVTIHDVGQANGLFFFVMEYIDGANLRQTLQAGKLEPQEALAIVPQICDALQFAHDEGIVHRDIKPENVLIDLKGRVKIADFGLAKLLGDEQIEVALTHTNQVMGTLRYMAPEQMQDTHDVDHRADIYSLGVVFYELLTGTVPMGRFEPPSRKVKIDVRLDEVVLRALAQEPDQRYQHASDVKTDVERLRSQPAADGSAQPPRHEAFAGGDRKKPSLDGQHSLDVDLIQVSRELSIPAIGLLVVGVLTCLTAALPIFVAIKTSHDVYDGRTALIPESELPSAEASSASEPLAASDIPVQPSGEHLNASAHDEAPAVAEPQWSIAGRAIHAAGMLRHVVLFVLVMLIPTTGIMIAWGGWTMKHLQSRGLALTASILALIPCQPVFILGPIFGIWSLIVLNRSHVKAAFKTAKSLPPPSPAEELKETAGQDYIGVGVALGAAFGIAIGAAMDNIGLGIALGVAMGVAFGSAFSTSQPKDADGSLAVPAKPPTEEFKLSVRDQLRRPAIGLMIAGIVNLVGALAVLAIPFVTKAFDGFDEGAGFVEGKSTFAEATFLSIIIALCGFASGIMLLIGAARMLDLQSYGISLLAAMAALLPVAIGFPISLPFGIWALLVISRHDVKKAFADVR